MAVPTSYEVGKLYTIKTGYSTVMEKVRLYATRRDVLNPWNSACCTIAWNEPVVLLSYDIDDNEGLHYFQVLTGGGFVGWWCVATSHIENFMQGIPAGYAVIPTDSCQQ